MSLKIETMYKITGAVTQLATSSASKSQTNALQFVPTQAGVVCSGVRFYWIVATSKTVKCSLWNSSNTRLANVTVTVASTGTYIGTFSTPQTLTAGSVYRVSVWQDDGTKTTIATLSNSTAGQFIPELANSSPRPLYAGRGVLYTSAILSGVGDVQPSATVASEIYVLEPVILP